MSTMSRVCVRIGVSLAILVPSGAIPAFALDGRTPGGKPFIPQAGFRRTVQMLDVQRRLKRSGMAFAAAAPVRPVWGERRLPVILVQFTNRLAPDEIGPSQFAERLFSISPPNEPVARTMRQFYHDISYGKLDVNGNVLGWYTAPKNDSYYDDEDANLKQFGELLEFGLQQADVDVDFGLFDNDGPDGRPNSGDDDGIADLVAFVHSEAGQECSTPATQGNIWSHMWNYSKAALGHDGPFRTGDVRKDRDGNTMLGPDGEPETIVVDDYIIQPAQDCSSTDAHPRMVEIGVFCHEFGHALALPDLYDRTDGDLSEGVGNWCLMAGGSYGGDGQSSHIPVHMSAWCKQRLDWGTVEPIESTTTLLTLEPVQQRGLIYRYDVPGTDGDEYFLIEFRGDKTWSGPQAVNWESNLMAAGLAIWHIDDRVGRLLPDGTNNEDWPFSGPDQGQNDSPSIPGKPKHSLVSLLQADTQLHLENANNRADAGDLWVSGQSFPNEPNASNKAYGGASSGIALTSIDIGGRKVSIAITLAAPLPAPPEGPITHAGDERRTNAAPRRPQATSQPAPGARKRVVSEPDNAERRNAREISAKLDARKAKKGAKIDPRAELTDGEIEGLKGAPDRVIREEFAPEHARAVLEAVKDKRRSVVSAAAQPRNPAQTAVVDLLKKQAPAQSAELVADETGKYPQRVTKLALPRKGASVRDDAQSRIADDLKPMFAGVDLELAADVRPARRAVRAQQVVQVENQRVPVWGKGVDLHYSKDGSKLTALAASVVPTSDVKVSGGFKLAHKKVLDDLGRSLSRPALADAEQKGQSQKGVFLLDGDPARGRASYRVTIPAGAAQEPIQVVVDAETGEVLSLE